MEFPYMNLFAKTATELMTEILPNLLTRYGYENLQSGGIDKWQNAYLLAAGNIPVLLVAHVDTVFPIEEGNVMNIIYDKDRNIVTNVNQGSGLGADDRAGVAAILHILETTDLRPHILFTNYEERGCSGSIIVVKTQVQFPEFKYMLELDRRGENDCVFYQLVNNDFQMFVESYGFKTEIGSFSDTAILMPYTGIAGANLSVGYFGEHRTKEYFNVNHWHQTVRRVINMLRIIPGETFRFATEMATLGRYDDFKAIFSLSIPYLPPKQQVLMRQPVKRQRKLLKAEGKQK